MGKKEDVKVKKQKSSSSKEPKWAAKGNKPFSKPSPVPKQQRRGPKKI